MSFTASTFQFLERLAGHNDRSWFEAHKEEYEAYVRTPALEHIEAMEPLLADFAPEFVADARKTGGSLMRVYRDTRFSRDKTPYKTNVGIMFRHALGRDVHAPGFYLHVAPEGCFLGVGSWHPEADLLGRIRERIAAQPASWRAARDDRAFNDHWRLVGDTLTRPPRDFAPDHPEIADIKRKDFIGQCDLTRKEVTDPQLAKRSAARFAAATPFMRFLCEAAGVPY
ncbi:MAG: DUF2461 domain-containing protein [Magnetococcales bacterium]|nr:DUF2461 domain-containing protein [Magnetococcales bacterium]